MLLLIGDTVGGISIVAIVIDGSVAIVAVAAVVVAVIAVVIAAAVAIAIAAVAVVIGGCCCLYRRDSEDHCNRKQR